ncbi:unnamed protein product [Calicophoron daubneyi]|uniref:Poly [ADP-ribose] polymerase n=1 Tax=Calicophoron daubneyi TaxID=300641 RepID=A0AAV2TIS1_CALDB
MKRPLGQSQDSVSTKKIKPDPSLVGSAANDDNNVKKVLIKGKAPVDSFCTQKVGVAHVYYEGEDVYDVMLNQTNLQHNNNKYYVIQLLEDDGTKNYSVWFRWGRVGKAGQNKLESFGSDIDSAKDSFTKKFYDKTLNEWECRDNFIKHNGKYDLVKLDYGISGEDNTVELKPEEDEVKPVESDLPKPVQLLLQLICDLKSMEEAVSEFKYDPRRAPLGKLTKEQIKAGYIALNRITDCIAALSAESTHTKTEEQSSKTKSGRPKRSSSSAGEKKNWQNLLLLACNEFYTRIPHDFGMRVPPLLRTMDEVKEKLDLLKALDDIEYAVTILKKKASSTQNLMDVQYAQLHCDLRPMDRSEPLYEDLKDYLESNRGPTHNWYTLELIDLFECHKPEESTQFVDRGNRMLLWHGSRLTNWVGILGRGLKVAPAEAPSTGYMFGKGIYFADCSTKSANYAYPTRVKNVGLVALCEVSLGDSNELYQACYTANELPSGKSSVKGIGRLEPDRKTWKTLDDNMIIPTGKLIPPVGVDLNQAALQFNEYVVYDPRQVRLRFVMKLKFNFL